MPDVSMPELRLRFERPAGLSVPRVERATEIWAVLRSRATHERVLLMTGAAAIAAGLLLWLRPDHGANAIANVTGGYTLVSGILMPTAAWRLRDTMTL
ncbi:hypothetical protein ACH3WN_15395 [Streptomyces albogriseolus]|uniref:hypothetical protein n=1 Tax=Streptomyces albogriseolus TaxID=1887 RepID=UPI00378AF8E8